MANRLNNKVALITGSGRGIGLAIAALFAREGARIVLSDVNDSLLKEAEAGIQALGAEVINCKADVTSQTQVEDIVKKTVDNAEMITIAAYAASVFYHSADRERICKKLGFNEFMAQCDGTSVDEVMFMCDGFAHGERKFDGYHMENARRLCYALLEYVELLERGK